MSRFAFVCLFSLGLLPGQTDNAKVADPPKAESLVLKPERTIEFTTDEATWMSVDVSPDGQTLLVDLRGDLYTVPASGGPLKPLATGMQLDYQSRFSPDGRQIAFISDRGGSDNVWLMNADGTGAKPSPRKRSSCSVPPRGRPTGSTS